MALFDASKTFKNVVSIRARLERYGDVDEDVELYSDLYIALTVLEKLEIAYSKSLLSMNEYESELSVAVQQCTKCHTLVKSKVGGNNASMILAGYHIDSYGLFCSSRLSVRSWRHSRIVNVPLEGHWCSWKGPI